MPALVTADLLQLAALPGLWAQDKTPSGFPAKSVDLYFGPNAPIGQEPFSPLFSTWRFPTCRR